MNFKHSLGTILSVVCMLSPASLTAQEDRSLEEAYAEKCSHAPDSEVCKVLKEAIGNQAEREQAQLTQAAAQPSPEVPADISAVYAEANARGLTNLQRTQDEVERFRRETEQYERDLAAQQVEVARYNAEMEEVRRKEEKYRADLEKSEREQEAYLASLDKAGRRKATASPPPTGKSPKPSAGDQEKKQEKKKEEKVCLAEAATGSIMSRRVCRAAN